MPPIADASELPVKWNKSSLSGAETNCVEVAIDVGMVVYVRDSKDPSGPAHVFDVGAWAAFIETVKVGDIPTS